jgi:hypothetical protein
VVGASHAQTPERRRSPEENPMVVDAGDAEAAPTMVALVSLDSALRMGSR